MPIYITDDHHVLRIEHKAVKGVDTHELYILEADGSWTPIPLIKTFRPDSPGGVVDAWDDISYQVDEHPNHPWDYVTLPTDPTQSGIVHSRLLNNSYAFKISRDVDESDIGVLQGIYASVKTMTYTQAVEAPGTPSAPPLPEEDEHIQSGGSFITEHGQLFTYNADLPSKHRLEVYGYDGKVKSIPLTHGKAVGENLSFYRINSQDFPHIGGVMINPEGQGYFTWNHPHYEPTYPVIYFQEVSRTLPAGAYYATPQDFQKDSRGRAYAAQFVRIRKQPPGSPSSPLQQYQNHGSTFEPTRTSLTKPLDAVLSFAERKHKEFSRFRWFYRRGEKADAILAAMTIIRSKENEMPEDAELRQGSSTQLVLESGLYSAVSAHRTKRKQGTDIKTASQKELESLLPGLYYKL